MSDFQLNLHPPEEHAQDVQEANALRIGFWFVRRMGLDNVCYFDQRTQCQHCAHAQFWAGAFGLYLVCLPVVVNLLVFGCMRLIPLLL